MKVTARTAGLLLAAWTFIGLTSGGCRQLSDEQRQANAELAGVWQVYQQDTETGNEYGQSMIGLVQEPDGRLRATHVDLRPSGLVWIDESDISYQDGILGYQAPDWGGSISSFTGKMDEDGESIKELTEDRYRRIWRRAEAEEEIGLVQHIESILNLPERQDYVYQAPAATGDGWVSAGLADVGMAEGPMVELVRDILAGRHGDIHSLLVIRNGRLVLEEYFRANGALHSSLLNERYRNRPHHLASATKSITSLLVGIAIDQGLIENTSVPVLTFFPRYADLHGGGRTKILVRHLLTMTAGLEWQDERDVPGMWSTDDVVKYYLAKPVVAAPGSRFKYANGNTTTLGAIVESASGLKPNEFAERFLFSALGISEYSWQSYSDGTTDTDGGLALRARDLARIGLLVLRNGEWNGEELLSADWVGESTTRHAEGTEDGSYGYSWWQRDFEAGNQVIESIFAWGAGGQYVFVFPALDLAVVSTGGNFDYKVERHPFRFIETHILPSIQPESHGVARTD